MATSPPNPHPLTRSHPKRRRLMVFILLALACLSLFYLGHGFCKISRRLNNLSSLYYSKNLEQTALIRSVESLERQLISTKRDNEYLSQQLSQHQTELSKVSKQVKELYTTIAKHSQEINNMKKELETTETVIQAMMTSQVADIKRHEDLWKAIRNLEESVKNHVDADTAQVIFETLFTKLDEITHELTQQKAKTEDLAQAKEGHFEKMSESIRTLEAAMENRVDIESKIAMVEGYDTKLNDMAKELNFQKTKTEEFSKSKAQQAAEMWKAIDILRSQVKKHQSAEDAAKLYVDFSKKLENMEKELVQQKAKLGGFDQLRDIKLHHFEEIWKAINNLRDSFSTWEINAKVEDLSQQGQNINLEKMDEVKGQQPEENTNKASEKEPIEENFSQDKIFVDDYDTTYRQNYKRAGYRKDKYSGRREKEAKNENHETKKQKTWDGIKSGFNQFRKKVQGEFEKMAEKVSDQVKKVREEVENYF